MSRSRKYAVSACTGDYVVGQGRPAKTGEKYYSLLRVEAINDLNPEISGASLFQFADSDLSG